MACPLQLSSRSFEIRQSNSRKRNHCVALGDFYKGHRLIAKARKQYEKAMEILPSHAAAKQALKELPAGK